MISIDLHKVYHTRSRHVFGERKDIAKEGDSRFDRESKSGRLLYTTRVPLLLLAWTRSIHSEEQPRCRICIAPDFRGLGFLHIWSILSRTLICGVFLL